MNAAIASGHTGKQSRVFTEIARQIGMIAQSLSDAITQIESATQLMTSIMMKCNIKNSYYQKFLLSLDATSNSIESPLENQKLIEQTALGLQTQVSELLSEATLKLQQAKPSYHRLKRVLDRVWSLIMNLKISANLADKSEQTFFLSIAASLEKMAQESNEIYESLMKTITKIESEVDCCCVQEHKDAV